MTQPTSSERLARAMEMTRQQWQAQRQAEPQASVSATSSAAFTIALSREAGAKGSLVARAVGERLGWPVYDRELLQLIGQEMGLRTRLLNQVDEKRKSWLQELLESLSAAPHVTEGGYVRHLLETMLALAAHGDCVIVGRGAAQVLPPATTLRIRLVGPVAERIASLQHKFLITREEAARWVEKADRERAKFVQDHFRKDSADPRQYDLILNSSRFSVAQCADLIVEALRRLQGAVPASPAAHPAG